MTVGDGRDDGELLAEQRRFYRADAEPFDRWLGSLSEEGNDDPVARRYRSGRQVIADAIEQWSPLGHVLEIAAGTGRLAEIYLPRAASVVLMDASPESLAIAARRLTATGSDVSFVEADVFEWRGPDRGFDTIFFSAWLHHVPHSRFAAFWRTVESLLVDGGRVVFDLPDARVGPPGRLDVPEEPTEEYALYAPADGVSIRDHFGRRWRVVHNLWEPQELDARLVDLGWAMTLVGPGLFENVLWAQARCRERRAY